MFRTTPLCMSQYPRLFGTTRIPRPRRDEYKLSPDSRHVVVLSRGHIYALDVFDERGEVCVTEKELEDALRAMRADSLTFPLQYNADNSVGILTTEGREQWARMREALVAAGNGPALDTVDSAILAVCLDDASPASARDMARAALHGTSDLVDPDPGGPGRPNRAGGEGVGGRIGGVQAGGCMNRWFDKGLQIIVCQNGAAGINFEHSTFDGHTVLRFASDVFTETILRFAEAIRGGFTARDSAGMQTSTPTATSGAGRRGGRRLAVEVGQPAAARFRRVDWQLTEEITHAMRVAEARFSDLIPQIDLHVLEYAGYGKTYITAQSLSPDAFVQVAIQLAYYQVYGETVTTYETLMTKKFFHGRTEAGFAVTPESVRLARTFAAASLEDRRAALRAAVDAHVAVVRLGAEGRGIRHLFALSCLAARRAAPPPPPAADPAAVNPPPAAAAPAPAAEGVGGIPALFRCEAWRRANHHVLSTSNCGNPALRLFGFGPVVPDGFGVGYLIKDDNIQFCASSRHRQTERLLAALCEALDELRDALDDRAPRRHSITSPILHAARRTASGAPY